MLRRGGGRNKQTNKKDVQIATAKNGIRTQNKGTEVAPTVISTRTFLPKANSLTSVFPSVCVFKITDCLKTFSIFNNVTIKDLTDPKLKMKNCQPAD